ncbi:hypothetical protein CLV62_101498 [Dysgonomonas alginatilytica]|uniref:Leucine rich repeat (LRR) protein n=1 Tax=Dysgonomonas alginatilytica TaxID=1605892 RepID=A0A2V3PUD1_9BACT|nr:hypothetical protein [Dysgonomonas alginatilytica]PXV69229.1 hypothetical protein CLV62_101498 [Dysgonomonas alginatilytica]
MYKIIYLFLIVFVATSCEQNNDSPFLYITDRDAQIVEMNVEIALSENLVFTPIIHVSQMIVNWGDGSRLVEYVNPDSTAVGSPHLRPLRYAFPSTGSYTVNFRAIRVTRLDISIDSVGQAITGLNLTNCRHLKAFVLKNQSLKSVGITTSGLKAVDFGSLSLMENFTISKCDSLSGIVLKNNPALNTISLSDNRLLSATALNALFQQLPQTASDTRTITLSNNAGDATCDKTIATRKGWTVKIE